jgi:hypothetical protein
MSEVMSQSECNVEKTAEDFVAKRFPSFDSAGTKLIVSETAGFWEVTYQLPAGTLGGVPIVTIDKRTCTVVRAQHSQ